MQRMKTVTTVIELVSLALIVAGVALVAVWAALIVAGLGGLLLSWRLTQ